jgi:hypothetical protein
MDEQETHSDGDLDLGIKGDDVADTTATDTNTESQEEAPAEEVKDEQEQDALELGDETQPNKGKAESAKEEQADAWAKKIKSGDKTIDDLPTNLAWLKPDVEAKLGTSKEDPRDTVRKVLAEEKEQAAFKSLESELNDMGLTNDQKVSLSEKYKVFKGKGLSPLDSLQTACEALSIDPQEAYTDAKRQAMRLRTPGNYKKASGADASDLHGEAGYAAVKENVPEEKRKEYLRKLIQ